MHQFVPDKLHLYTPQKMMKEMAAALLLVMLISLSVAEGNFTLQLS